MNCRTIILFVFCFLSITSIADDFAIDSLNEKLKGTKNDTIKIDIINSLGFEYRKISPSKSLEYANMGLELSNSINYSTGKINAYILLGIINKNLGEFDKAAKNYYNALMISEKIGDKARVSSCLNNIGNIYQAQNNYTKALQYYKRSLKTEEELKNKEQISIRFYNIGVIYDLLDSLDKAYAFYYNSLLIEQELKNKEGVLYALYGIAGVDNKKGQYDNAMKSIQKALKISRELNDNEGIAVCYSELGKLYRAKKLFPQAIQSFDTSMYYANIIDFKNEIKDAYRDLARTYKDMGISEKAYLYLNKYVALDDSMNSIEINNKVAELEAKFEIDKKEKEIQFFKKTSELQEQKTKTERRNRYFLLVTFFLSIILSISNLYRIINDDKVIFYSSAAIFIALLLISYILLQIGISGYTFTLYNYFSVFVNVLTIAVFPMFLVVLIAERILLNRNLKTADIISEQIKNYTVPVNNKKVSLMYEPDKSPLELLIDNLVCIEANDNYCAIYYYKANVLKKDLYRTTLKNLEDQLIGNDEVVRCHKSYIVNIFKIKRISGNAQGYKLHFKDINFDIPVSRRFPKAIMNQIKSNL